MLHGYLAISIHSSFITFAVRIVSIYYGEMWNGMSGCRCNVVERNICFRVTVTANGIPRDNESANSNRRENHLQSGNVN